MRSRVVVGVNSGVVLALGPGALGPPRKGWPEQPFQQIAQRIRLRSDWVVGDFGCAECLLGEALRDNQVIQPDHVGCNEDVLACDISSTPLEDASLDVPVFSLSLMGVNWRDYLKEAYRTLKPYGHLIIAEPAKKWQDRTEELEEAIQVVGLRIMGDVEQRYGFLYLTAVKAQFLPPRSRRSRSHRAPRGGAQEGAPELRPGEKRAAYPKGIRFGEVSPLNLV